MTRLLGHSKLCVEHFRESNGEIHTWRKMRGSNSECLWNLATQSGLHRGTTQTHYIISLSQASPVIGISCIMIWGGAERNKVHNKCNTLESSWIHPASPAGGSWKNCLPRNQSLMPKSLETTALSYGRKSESHSVVSDSLWPHGLYSLWNSPGQNPGVGSCSLPQGIFPTQGLNPGLPHCRQILYQLSHNGSPGILEWVAYPFSSRSSWLRNWAGVSCSSNL